MINSDDYKLALRSNIGECSTKLELINDYLKRFDITDSRLTAPIFDIERCIHIMIHIVHEHDSDLHGLHER